MRRRSLVLILFVAIIVIAVNALTYTSVLNGSNTILNLVKRFNIAKVTPKSYVNLARKLQQKPDYNMNQVDSIISSKSGEFITAAFQRDSKKIEDLLDSSASYIKSKDGSAFIRHIGNGIHVEGYMATDKKLLKTRQRWHVLEEDNTVTCSMEIYVENIETPQLWYLHFKKVENDWKLFMLENDI